VVNGGLSSFTTSPLGWWLIAAKNKSKNAKTDKNAKQHSAAGNATNVVNVGPHLFDDLGSERFIIGLHLGNA